MSAPGVPKDPENGVHGAENGVANPFPIDAAKLFEANEVSLTCISFRTCYEPNHIMELMKSPDSITLTTDAYFCFQKRLNKKKFTPIL